LLYLYIVINILDQGGVDYQGRIIAHQFKA